LPLEVPSTNEDWSNFIILIQNAITQNNHGIQNLRNEFNRLKANHEKRKIAIKEQGQDIIFA
jgi:hypothetical protein